MSDFIQNVKDKLVASSDYYSVLVNRKKRDMEIYSGNFWNEDTINACDRKDRICRNFTLYSKFKNAMVSPFSKSPYHADIEDPDGIYKQIQADIDSVENSTNTKYIFNQGVGHAAILGTGFFVMSIDNNKITPEVVRDVSQIALDPNIQELDGSDAEWGAVVNFISIAKAKRLYGSDVVNYDNSSILSYIGSQWSRPADSVAKVTYYEMNEDGFVDVTTICGNMVVEETKTIHISRIPIFRICFNEVVRNNKIDYNGIVDMTADLQFGMNLGYSTLLERANRSPKANFMMPAKALDGLDEFYKKLHTKESLVCLYNGDVAPTQIIENYQTQDLMATIQQCSDLMVQTIGIPNGGILPANNNMTATEILVQQNNSESNVNCLYDNAHNTIYSFSKTMIELLCWQYGIEKLPEFKLINGPQVVTKLMKRRQELLAVSSLVDETSRKIIAKQYIETLDDELKQPLLADIIANSPEITFVSDSNQDEDPRAVAALTNMNNVLEQTQNELEQQMMANAELKKEIDNLTIQLMNQKQQQLIDLQKHNDEMIIKQQELNLKAAEANVNIQTKTMDNEYKAAIENTKLQKEIVDLEKKKLDITNDYLGG